MIANKQDYLKELSEDMIRVFPENRRINLVFHGHSVPCGYTANHYVDTLSAYPHEVLRQLKKKFPMAVINVIVTGVGGENAIRGARRFEKEALCLPSDLIAIDYGLNDRFCAPDLIRSSWAEMIEKSLEQQKKVLLLTPSIDSSTDYFDRSLLKFDLEYSAEMIRELAEEYHVALADSYAAMKRAIAAGTPIGSLLAAANHPSPQGHKIIADEIVDWFPMI